MSMLRFLSAIVICSFPVFGCGPGRAAQTVEPPGSAIGGLTLAAPAIEEDLESLLAAIETIHPKPFRTHSRDEWTVRQESVQRRASLTLDRFYTEVLRTISLARDGHMDAYPPPSAAVLRAALPIKFVVFPDGLFIVAASPKYRLLLGTEILEFEGQPSSLVLHRLRTLVPSDNEWGKQELLEDYLRMPALLAAVGVSDEEVGLRLTARSGGSTRVVTIDPKDASDALPVGPPRRPPPDDWLDARDVTGTAKPLWQCCLERPFWYQAIPELNALYVQINRVVDDEPGDFARFIDALPRPSASGLSRFILDLRTNRGGDATLIQPLLHAMVRHWQYLEPGILFVLISNRTFSAAVHLAAELEKHTHATFVGEATAAPPNHYGDVRVVTLPHSGIEVEISSLYWQKSDPRDGRSAIYPDIGVPLTWGDFVHGRDPVLAAIAALGPGDPRLLRDRSPTFNWLRDSQRQDQCMRVYKTSANTACRLPRGRPRADPAASVG